MFYIKSGLPTFISCSPPIIYLIHSLQKSPTVTIMHFVHFALLSSLFSYSFAVNIPNKRQNKDAAFDYVIIGGGTAGLALAERLSENSNTTVAVVEAGGLYQITNPLLSSTPAGDVFWSGSSPADTNPLVDWNFVTQPQAGANGRSIHYARGLCLGGSSARNFMIYQRATVESMTEWAKIAGDSSYDWDNFLPWYKKSVKFTPPKSPPRAANASAEFNAAAFDANGGPLQVSYANYAGPFSSWMEGSFKEIGIPSTEDFNSGSLMGAQYCSSTIDPSKQMRDSSQTSFLDFAGKRANLQVYALTLAKKILFDANKKATGVVVSTAGIPYTLKARKEVIVSAGAFQSPQMLMVSGIGPASQLQANGIKVIKDLPGVGQGMQGKIHNCCPKLDCQSTTNLNI